MLYEIAPEYKIKTFEETGDVDFGYEISGISRFRANFFNPEERHRRRLPPDSQHGALLRGL
jgi:Tfp pilus assembly pilus retraction ATPase PilT